MHFSFGDCTIDENRRELMRAGAAVPVEPQVFDLLLYFISNRDRLVTRDEIIAAVWRGRIVSESTLASRIHAARAAIGDDGETQRFIKTIQRRGFRFVGQLIEATESEVKDSLSESKFLRPASLPRRPTIVFTASLLCVVATASVFATSRWRTPASIDGSPPTSFTDCGDCPEMVRLSAGRFMMGSPLSETARKQTEGEPRAVALQRAFAIGRYEISVEQYRAFLRATGDKAPSSCQIVVSFDVGDRIKVVQDASFEAQPNYEVSDKHPAGCISWHDAQSYVAWLRRRTGKPYRLPTEAEWEYAARAGTSTQFSFRDNEKDLCSHARFADLATPFSWRNICRAPEGTKLGATPIGSFKPNAFGLHDMHGNVWEWVEDCWTSNAAEIPTDGSAYVRPGLCEVGVVRGGSWAAGAFRLRSAARDLLQIGRRDQNMGFRVALSLE